MTEETFDAYRFSINTEVCYKGEWSRLDEVYLEDRYFVLKGSRCRVHCFGIEDIREVCTK